LPVGYQSIAVVRVKLSIKQPRTKNTGAKIFVHLQDEVLAIGCFPISFSD
jgi:hypothetical protein